MERVRALSENTVGVLVPGERAMRVRAGEGTVTDLSDGVHDEVRYEGGLNFNDFWPERGTN